MLCYVYSLTILHHFLCPKRGTEHWNQNHEKLHREVPWRYSDALLVRSNSSEHHLRVCPSLLPIVDPTFSKSLASEGSRRLWVNQGRLKETNTLLEGRPSDFLTSWSFPLIGQTLVKPHSKPHRSYSFIFRAELYWNKASHGNDSPNPIPIIPDFHHYVRSLIIHPYIFHDMSYVNFARFVDWMIR